MGTIRSKQNQMQQSKYLSAQCLELMIRKSSRWLEQSHLFNPSIWSTQNLSQAYIDATSSPLLALVDVSQYWHLQYTGVSTATEASPSQRPFRIFCKDPVFTKSEALDSLHDSFDPEAFTPSKA